MGWGCNADKRDAFLSEHKSSTATVEINPNATMVCIDGNASARSQAVGLRPAAHIARHILKPVTAQTTTVVVCFDNANVPDIRRHEVHVARQAQQKERAATAAEIDEFKDGATTPWEIMFASSAGKVKAFETIIQAMKEDIIRTAKGGCTYLITMPGDVSPERADSFIWSYPFDKPSPFASVLCKQFYGEAEAQLAVCIKHSAQEALATNIPVPPTALYTIDTDALYQMLGLWHPRLEVVLGNVWETPDGAVHRSLKRAQKASRDIKAANKKRKRDDKQDATIERKYRRVNISQLAQSLCGGSAIKMANAQWWQLLAGGCDYNLSGLSGFGWFNSTCLKLQTDLVIDKEGLHLHTFADILLGCRNKRCQEKEVAKFCEVLARTVFSWRYYQWEDPDSAAATAEPAYNSTMFTAGGAQTVTEWLRRVKPKTIIGIGWRPELDIPTAAQSSDRVAAAAYCVGG
ncbi:MAG: hypothetical protein CL678_11890 [Bdellovibrionaceae bacterium]|nr:hypothetical protein [Pseudobdellovibrionaceae bacterium]